MHVINMLTKCLNYNGNMIGGVHFDISIWRWWVVRYFWPGTTLICRANGGHLRWPGSPRKLILIRLRLERGLSRQDPARGISRKLGSKNHALFPINFQNCHSSSKTGSHSQAKPFKPHRMRFFLHSVTWQRLRISGYGSLWLFHIHRKWQTR